MRTDPDGFWDRVKEKRKEKKLSQIELAEKCGIKIKTLERWTADLTLPDLERGFVIAHLLGVSLEYLITGEISSPCSHVEQARMHIDKALRFLSKSKYVVSLENR